MYVAGGHGIVLCTWRAFSVFTENSVGNAGLGGTGKVLLLHLRALSSTGHKGCEVR